MIFVACWQGSTCRKRFLGKTSSRDLLQVPGHYLSISTPYLVATSMSPRGADDNIKMLMRLLVPEKNAARAPQDLLSFHFDASP